jgi:hypothetical protein
MVWLAQMALLPFLAPLLQQVVVVVQETAAVQ